MDLRNSCIWHTVSYPWKTKDKINSDVTAVALSLFLLVLFAPPCLAQAASGYTFSEPQLSSPPYTFPANTFERGQCTWYVFGRVLEMSGMSLQFTRETGRGAELWAQLLSPQYRRTSTPERGAIAVWKHRTRPDYGHVAYVEGVYGNLVIFTEANFSVRDGFDGVKVSTVANFERDKGGMPWDFLGYVVPGQSQPLADDVPFAPGNVWKGEYKCRQGLTALVLRVNSVSEETIVFADGRAYEIAAVFEFNYNNGAAAGAFNLIGRYYPNTRVAVFEPREWIVRPATYRTVGMEGRVAESGRAFAGTISSSGCGNFAVALE